MIRPKCTNPAFPNEGLSELPHEELPLCPSRGRGARHRPPRRLARGVGARLDQSRPPPRPIRAAQPPDHVEHAGSPGCLAGPRDGLAHAGGLRTSNAWSPHAMSPVPLPPSPSLPHIPPPPSCPACPSLIPNSPPTPGRALLLPGSPLALHTFRCALTQVPARQPGRRACPGLCTCDPCRGPHRSAHCCSS